MENTKINTDALLTQKITSEKPIIYKSVVFTSSCFQAHAPEELDLLCYVNKKHIGTICSLKSSHF